MLNDFFRFFILQQQKKNDELRVAAEEKRLAVDRARKEEEEKQADERRREMERELEERRRQQQQHDKPVSWYIHTSDVICHRSGDRNLIGSSFFLLILFKMGRKTWYSLGRAPKIERLNLDWVAMFEEKRGRMGFLCVTQHRPGIESVSCFYYRAIFITIYWKKNVRRGYHRVAYHDLLQTR